jgi:Ca2+-binding EF-hand superfamily protein
MKSIVAAAALTILSVATPAFAQGFDMMGMADTDHDGKVTLAEFTAFRETGWGYFAQGAESVKAADLPDMAKNAFKGIKPDANGMVTHAAYTAATPAMFKQADKNGNGSLDAEELATVA